jgi:hypothetical protein
MCCQPAIAGRPCLILFRLNRHSPTRRSSPGPTGYLTKQTIATAPVCREYHNDNAEATMFQKNRE